MFHNNILNKAIYKSFENFVHNQNGSFLKVILRQETVLIYGKFFSHQSCSVMYLLYKFNLKINFYAGRFSCTKHFNAICQKRFMIGTL